LSTGHAPTAHLKKTLYQELRAKNEEPFFEDTFTFGKIPILIINFQAIFVQKNLLRPPLGITYPCLLTLSSSSKKYDDGW